MTRPSFIEIREIVDLFQILELMGLFGLAIPKLLPIMLGALLCFWQLM
jgi:hypothetical protein